MLGIGVMVVLQLSIILLGFGGYAQRLLLALLFAWTSIAAFHLLRSPADGTSVGANRAGA